MSVRVSVQQAQEELPELMEQAVQSGQECIVQRDGKDYAVIVSARQWQQQRTFDEITPADVAADVEESRSREIGLRLDSLGPEYRLSPEKQARLEELLAQREAAPLAPSESQELETLVALCDEIMLRRARALSRVL